MSLEDAFRMAARAAESAVLAAMDKYGSGDVTDEDDLTGVLIGRLDSVFDSTQGGIQWSSSILRHRKGAAAQEKRVGADMLIHVSINTPTLKYSKGVLIQAKRLEKGAMMTVSGHQDLIDQCNKMLSVSPASFVFDYAKGSMRCGSATRITGSSSRELYKSCNLTPYRFFFELFRCTTGDPRITSSRVDELGIPVALYLSGHAASN